MCNTELAKFKRLTDTACKRLMARADIMACILNSCTDEFRDIEATEIRDRCLSSVSPEIGSTEVLPKFVAKVQSTSSQHGTEFTHSRYGDIKADMCNYSDYIFSKGEKSGILKGRAEGRSGRKPYNKAAARIAFYSAASNGVFQRPPWWALE